MAFSASFATPEIPNCPYQFTHGVVYGQTDEQVPTIQQILNSDKRTVVATTGVGSPGRETSFYGKATREAMKRFQALFIEFIGTADGKFNSRTQTVMQNICDGKTPDGKEKTPDPVPTNVVPQDPPQIKIYTNETSLEPGQKFRVILDSSNDIKSVSQSGLILEGAISETVRKLSKKQYALLLTTNDDAKKVSIQIESEAVTDVNDTKNDEASNEINLNVVGAAEPEASSTEPAQDDISSILAQLLQSAGSSSPATTWCYGTQIRTTDPCNAPASQQPQLPQQPDNSLMQLLSGLMKGLGGGGGGGQQGGGGDKGGGQQGGGNQNGGGDKNSPGKDGKTPDGKGDKDKPKDGKTEKADSCKYSRIGTKPCYTAQGDEVIPQMKEKGGEEYNLVIKKSKAKKDGKEFDPEKESNECTLFEPDALEELEGGDLRCYKTLKECQADTKGEKGTKRNGKTYRYDKDKDRDFGMCS